MKPVIVVLVITLALTASGPAGAGTVTEVNFLESMGLGINAAGPLFVQVDAARNRVIAANTLTSSLSIIDAADGTVKNIPLTGRTLQHLKAEALAIRGKTGDIYLIGTRCVHFVDVRSNTAISVPTGVQFESIAVNEETGNAFLAGRESRELALFAVSAGKITLIPWLEEREEMINLNQTPPPPVRKVLIDNELQQLVAVDGLASTLYLFDAVTGKPLRSRPLALARGGRWHLAGYNQAAHALYLVTETVSRKVIEAARIGIGDDVDTIVELPGYTEGVGIIYNPLRDEVYIPYDNHPSVHVVDFSAGGAITEIAIPAYGNDASALDLDDEVLFIGSWAYGEVDLVDVKERKLLKRITDLGIIPHMFTMAFNPNNGNVYYPKGASAVNGTFGAAITVLDPVTETTSKIRTGWAPVDCIELPERNSVLVFDNEDQFAEVRAGGAYTKHDLPVDYPVRAIHSPEGNTYLSYGPHQSYWPVVYIWGARDGVITIESSDLGFYDRRIPRQAHEMVLDEAGTLYFTQNNWGREQQFIGVLPDEVRMYDAGRRLALADTVQREITQRILEYDSRTGHLYLVRVGELDTDPGILQVIDPAGKEIVSSIPVGVTATDLLFDERSIYVANFDSKSVSVVDKDTWLVRDVPCEFDFPLRLAAAGGEVWVLGHTPGIHLQQVTGAGESFVHDTALTPDNLFRWGDRLVISAHDAGSFALFAFDPAKEKFERLHRFEYPYGDTRFDTGNVSFYVRGQFGDAVFDLTRGIVDREGRLWVTDFLSGRAFILGGR